MISWTLFQLVVSAMIFGIGLIWLGNYLARNYVSQDQTLYTRMLHELHEKVAVRSVHRQRGSRKELIDSFDDLVELDSYFRLRREMWMRFSPQLVFLTITVIGLVVISLESDGLRLTELFDCSPAMLGLVSALLIRHLYGCLQLGLFAFPLYLGVVLSIPEGNIRPDFRTLPDVDSLIVLSESSRLSQGPRRKFRWEFECGDRVQILASQEPQNIVKLLAGKLNDRQGTAWHVVHNGKRFSYNAWKHMIVKNCHLSPNMPGRSSMTQLLFGKTHENLTNDDIHELFDRIATLPFLDELEISATTMRREVCPDVIGWEKAIAIQIIAAITTTPKLITIDPVITKYPSDMFDELLNQLSVRCPDSIIFGFENLPFAANKTIEIR